MYFMPTYPNANQWSTTHHVQISTVSPADPAAANGLHPPTITMEQQTHVFDANLQKELLSEYERASKIKFQEYAKFLADKKALITIIFSQCDEVTKTEIALVPAYIADRQAGRLIEFLERLRQAESLIIFIDLTTTTCL